MKKRIKDRKTIYVVVRNQNDAGWILSQNIKAFFDKEAADYYARGLQHEDDPTIYYEVEPLTLIELA